MRKKGFWGLLLLFAVVGCRDIGLTLEIFVYSNEFETGDYTGIDRVFISEFDGTKLMGPFTNSGFNVSLDNLPDHDFIRVAFDLYIHDSWEGNTNQRDDVNFGHDAFIIELDTGETVNPADKIRFETTFSNGLCIPGWCFSQSYPNEFPFSNEARTGSKTRSTFGRCLWQDTPNGTSIYRISKVFPHSKSSVAVAFFDELVQQDNFDHHCDESWSLDNITISVFRSL